jgi:hypothetical protein
MTEAVFCGPKNLFCSWNPLNEALMRALFALFALLGVAGVVIGVLTIIGGSRDLPFRFENYGGPGPIIAGLIVIATSLYLRSIWTSRN